MARLLNNRLYRWAEAHPTNLHNSLNGDYLKIVAGPIRVDYCLLAFLASLASAVLHAQNTLVALVVNVLEDILVIDFSGGRFLPAGIVTEMEGGDFAPGHIDIRNQVAFGDLLVIYVVDNFDRGAVDCPADHVGLRNLG